MDTSTIILTVGGGLVVGVIVLFIEYGYFQKKRRQTSTGEITQTTTSLSPVASSATPSRDVGQRWIDVIHESAKSFCKNQGVTLEDIQSMKIQNEKAYIEARAWTGNSFRRYNLVMDKTGDILEVNVKY